MQARFLFFMNIRKAQPDDLPAVIRLMREFAEFEKLVQYFTATRERLFDAIFGDTSFVDCLIAEDAGDIFAYSLFYPNFASFRGQRGIYLEDIYISPSHQGRGAGKAMIGEIAKIARLQGCERIDFQVLDWNKAAIGFYEKLGAVPDDSERHFKLTDAAFDRLAE
jgi:ribosomal protein S18 acetylase RimI-like enzyme